MQGHQAMPCAGGCEQVNLGYGVEPVLHDDQCLSPRHRGVWRAWGTSVYSIVLFVFHYSETITAKILKLDAFQRGRLKTTSIALQLCGEEPASGLPGAVWGRARWLAASLGLRVAVQEEATGCLWSMSAGLRL